MVTDACPWTPDALRDPARPNDDEIAQLLRHCPRIAVLGVHSQPERAAYYVPEYLQEHGYQIIGVNPVLRGEVLFGHPVVGSLAEVPGPIDLVDVFRRPEAIPAHVDELIAAHPKVVWFQLGIRNDSAAAALREAGITVVQDRCTLADHRRLRLGPPVAA